MQVAKQKNYCLFLARSRCIMPNLNNQVLGSSIAFIDSQVPDYQSLVAGVTPGTEVVVLDGQKDAIAQITEILALRTNIDSIHIVSHGAPGSLQLGNGSLNADDLEGDRHCLQQWFLPLGKNRPNILLYGCEVAAGETGLAFVKRLSELTGASVAASQNLTGSVAKGGDWELEVTTGKIETPLVFREDAIAAYSHVLSSFSTATNFSAGLAPTATPFSIGTGDFNGDGFPDLAVVNLNSKDISILLGTGTGSFGTATNLSNPGNESPFFSAVGDFNGDSKLDLAVTNPTSGANGNFVSIRLGTGTGSFGNSTNFGAGINPRSIAAGDFNGDGRLDLVTAPLNGTNLSILVGDGTGSFSTPVTINAVTFNANASAAVATADFNGDGKLDLVSSNNTATNNISVVLGDGTGNFSAPVNFSAGTGVRFVVTGDFNGDSKLDLAVSNVLSKNVSVLLGDGTGNFATATNFNVGLSPESVVAGDFNNDGKLDLAASNGGDNNVSVLLGDGTGSFGTAVNFSVGTQPRSIAAGDFNADGKLDLATPNFTSKNVSILLNTPSNVSFVPPKVGNTYNVNEGATDTVVNVPVTISNSSSFGDVVVPIVIDPSSTATQGADYTLSTTSLTFPANTTTLTQNIAVTIKADNIVDTNEQIVLNFGKVTGGIAGKSQGKISILDRNSSYSMAANNPSVIEGNFGKTPAAFTITRNGSTELWSTVDYAITGTATNGTDYNNIGGTSGATAATGKISFAAGETSKTVTFDVLGDANIEPDETVVITLSNPVSPGGAPTIATATATTIKNDDSAGFTVSPNAISTTEAGGKATFTVKLNSQPSANVTFGLSSSNVAEGTVSTNSLTFTPANYSQPQTVTVTGVDDLVADGNVVYKVVTAAAVSTDPNYNNLNPDDVTVTNSDNETPGITVNPTAGLTTGEDGSKVSFAVILNTQPTAIVTIGLNSSNVAEGTVSTNSLTFTPANWNAPQSVIVTGVDDSIVDGDIDYKVITAATVSTDPNYSNKDVADVSLTNKDNDTAGVSITPTETTATEGGANGTYSAVLKSQPIAPVTLTLTTGNQIEPIAPITFTPNNWNVSQPVTVKAVDDAIVEGAHSGNITHSVTSSDAKYNGIVVAGVVVAITDNDIAPKPIDNNGTGTGSGGTGTGTGSGGTGTGTGSGGTGTGTEPSGSGTGTEPSGSGTGTGSSGTGTGTGSSGTGTGTGPSGNKVGIGGNDTPAGGIIGTDKNWCGVEAGLNQLEKILDNQLQTIKLPIIGPLKDIYPNFIDNFKSKLVDTIKNGANQSLSQLESSIRNTLGPDFDVKVDGNSTSDESTLLITLGKKYQFPDINLSKDLGVPVLGLNIDGKAKSKYEYNLSLGVGVSKELGCYIDTDKTKLTANIDLALNDEFKAKGNLGFFQVDLANDTNNPTKVDANLKVKLNDLDNLGGPNDGSRLTLPELQGNYQFKDLFNANLTSNANLGLTGKTSINGNAAFPSYNFDLAVNWPILNYANGQLTGPQKPTVAFNNMQLDLGTFVNNFAKPIIGKISDVIKPFRPVINFLNADTKLLSKLGLAGQFDKNGDGKVSVLELAAKLSGRDIDTRFLDAVAKIDKVVDLATQIANSPDKIDFGSYTLGNIDVSDQSASLQNSLAVPKTAVQQTANQQINSKTSGKVKEFLNALQDIDGFDLPLLTKPETAIQLLIGKQDVPVLSYQMPKLGFDFNIEQKFPIWGPIKGLLEGKFSASAHLGFGYDTYGLSEWKNSNFAAGSADKLLDGFYVSDRENADGTGPDVDELSLDASIAVGAGLDVKIAEGYVKGGIQGKVGIDLIDIGEFQPKGGGDGKIRVSEIDSRISKPWELFDVTGQVNAFLGAQVKSISVKFCEKTIVGAKQIPWWLGGGTTPAITVPYPCGLDYKTVYDKKIDEFELAKFGVEPTLANPRSLRVPLPTGVTRGRTPVVSLPPGVTRGRTPVVPLPTGVTRGRTPVVPQSQSDGTGSTGGTTSGMVPTRGRAVNSYLAGAKVFFDADFNGIQDDSEPFAITNVDGSFDLEVSLFNFDLNNSGDLEPEEGRIAIIGGINTSTYLPQQTPLFATPDAIVVTPLTTLLTELVQQGTDQNQAQIQVKSALGLSSEIDLTSYDPLEAITQNDPNALAVYAAHAQVQNTIVLITDLISGASTTAKNEIADRVISTVTNQIKSGTLDLSNSTQVQAIIQSAASQLQVPQLSSIAPDAAKIIAEGNQQIKAIASNNSSPSDAATQIARIQKVEQGEVAKDLQQVAAGSKTIQSAIFENTGASLTTQIQSATVNNPTLRNTLDTDDSITPSTPDDTLPSSGIEFVKDGQNTAESTDGDDTLMGGASDDVLRGKKGSDLLFGLDGNDWLNGNQGNDLVDGGMGDDTLYGGKGFDTLTGGAGNDFLSGNRGEDILIGEKGDDSLRGGQGNDILVGGEGNDFLSGDLGDDTLVGGVGSDRFLLSTNSGIDTIDDFEIGKDFLVLGNGLSFSQLTIAQGSGATLIRFGQTGEILASLSGVSASSISAVNFGLL